VQKEAEEDNETKLLIEIRRLMRTAERYASKLADKYGITVAQLVIIQEVDAHEKITEEELCEKLRLAAAVGREIIDRLIRLELVTAEQGKDAPAKRVISISEKGCDILSENPPLLQDTLLDELEKIDVWQKNMLLASFQRINNLLENENINAAPILAPGKITDPEPVPEGNIKRVMRPEKVDVELTKVTSLEELEKKVDVDDLSRFLTKHMRPFHDALKDTRQGIIDSLTGVPADGGFVVLAHLDDELMGALVMLATGMSNYIPAYCLLFVGVDSSERGLGIGQQIMDFSLKETDGNVYLHVDHGNPAKRLYERMGFFHSYAEMRFYKKRVQV